MPIVSQLRRYASAAWRHRWKALVLAWVVSLLGWAGAYSLPNQFQSSARIYADADAVLSTLLRGIAIDSSPAGQVDLLQRTLLSRPNLEKIVARTGLDMRVVSSAARETVLADLAKQIRIVPQTRNLFTVEYRDTDPQLARDVVQTTLTLFIEAATGGDRAQMDNARGFLSQQIASYEIKLREAERRRAEFQGRYIDLLPSADGGVSRLEAARARVVQLRGELEDARTRRDLTRQQLELTPPLMTVSSEGVGFGGSGEGRLAEAERNLRELRLRFTEQHPDVVFARNAVAVARAGGDGGGASRVAAGAVSRPVSRPNPLHEQLRVRMVDVESQVASLERQGRDGQAELERLDAVARGEPEVQAQFTNLDRDYTVLRRNYDELLARRESLQLADAARTGSDRVKLEVVDPPTLPQTPSGPNRPLLAAAALAAGIGAGAALALLLVQLDTSFYSIHDLRRLGLPVLGGISIAQAPALRRAATYTTFAGASALLLIAFGVVLAGPGPVRSALQLLKSVVT